MDGRVDVLFHDLLRDHDGIFEVVTVPRHERDEHITPEGEFAVIGIRTVGYDLSLFHMLAFMDNRLLIDARAGV